MNTLNTSSCALNKKVHRLNNKEKTASTLSHEKLA